MQEWPHHEFWRRKELGIFTTNGGIAQDEECPG
jgi:hypothetical protein